MPPIPFSLYFSFSYFATSCFPSFSLGKDQPPSSLRLFAEFSVCGFWSEVPVSLLAIREATQLQDAPGYLFTCPPFIFNASNGALTTFHTNLSDVFYHQMENTLFLRSSHEGSSPVKSSPYLKVNWHGNLVISVKSLHNSILAYCLVE